MGTKVLLMTVVNVNDRLTNFLENTQTLIYRELNNKYVLILL
jgi:hypothetical protein